MITFNIYFIFYFKLYIKTCPKQLKSKQNMSDLMTLDECLAFNGDFKTIRVDKATQQASVIDLIRMITGQTSRDSGKALTRLGGEWEARCLRLRINGKGLETPVADAKT